jgi:hypothetical protein
MMNVERLRVHTNGAIPLMASLPYAIAMTQDEESGGHYDPETQLTVFAGHGGSTCRYDESVGGLFSKSRSDTQKDD